tara:strand:- start:18297 stop:18599 length:303 start_codon:yes stop_codon:yes gene_type:complete
MPNKKDHQGRTLDQEYRLLKKMEGSDRNVINYLLTDRYFAVRNMIDVRNKAVNIILKDLGNIIETDESFEVSKKIMDQIEEIDRLVFEFKHVADAKDHIL